MNRVLMAVALFFLNASGVFAQRHGRGDAVQLSSPQDREPHLLLQIRREKSRLYFNTSHLKKMRRSVLILPDPSTGISHKYEGVVLEHLLSAPAAGLQFNTLEVSYGHHQKKTILGTAMDSHYTPLVVDTIDGQKLTGYAPYFLVFQSQEAAGLAQPLQNVDLISVKTSPR
jgi:hypothetical protein